MSVSEPSLSLSALDLGYLGQFAGQAYNAAVLAALDAAGLEGLRTHHGYIVMHLLRGPMRLGDLAPLLGVTQQAVSKSVRELVAGGFVLREHSATDARVVMLELSARGVAAVELSREARAAVEADLRMALGAAAMDQARETLAAVLERLGGAEAVRGRRVRPER